MDQVISRDGTLIAYSASGLGPPLIVVDGAFSHRAINPSEPRLVSLLSPQFTVYTYDRRGRGESGDTQPYAVEREVDDLDALVSEAGGSAFVLGGSSGGVLALDAAARIRGIERLAVYEPPLLVDDRRPPLPDDFVVRLRALVDAGRRGDAVQMFFAQGMGMPPEAIAQMRAGPFWKQLEDVANTLPYDATLTADVMRGRPLPSNRWAAVTIPTLVINGGAGEAFMQTGADALAEILPAAERLTLPGQTHDVAPEALAPVLEAFFVRQPLAVGASA